MHKNEGMLLIELLLYLTLFTGMALVTMRWAVGMWQISYHMQKKRTALLHIISAHDLLVHDLQQVLPDAWQLHESTCLIWQGLDEDKGWLYEKESLWRIQGIYNNPEKQWYKKSKNLVAPGLKKVHFTYRGAWIDCTLENEYYAINTRIACHEGVP